MLYRKTSCVAMLLAGGQGSRLGVLTKKMAKPAVPFGGKYRIIDFPLSNCINSGIDTVGVLTQYQPLELNDYIGSGADWDLDRLSGGVHVLPPYQKNEGSAWYKGTANAVFQNIDFISRYNPDYVLILSGDHIYKMDYSKMIDFHSSNNADCTIAVIDVPNEEASRFGIMNTNDDASIYEFEEKPVDPKSTKASMGIYVFNWQILKKYLTDDEADENSTNDFGHDVIPKLLNDKKRLFAYEFEGYWKDVGTIDALWEANLDLLNPKINFNLADEGWRIYSKNAALPPHYVHDGAVVQNSLVSEGCNIAGDIEYSILFPGVTVEEGAVVEYSIVMPGTVIKKNAVVSYSIIAENCTIGENSHIGGRPEHQTNLEKWGVAVIGDNVLMEPNSKVDPDEMISNDAKGGNAQ